MKLMGLNLEILMKPFLFRNTYYMLFARSIIFIQFIILFFSTNEVVMVNQYKVQSS